MAPIVIYLANITKDDQDGKHHSTCHPMMSHTPSRTSTKYHNQITTLQNDLLVNKNTKINGYTRQVGLTDRAATRHDIRSTNWVGIKQCQPWVPPAIRQNCSGTRPPQPKENHFSIQEDHFTRFCHHHLTWARQQRRQQLRQFQSNVLVLTDVAACSVNRKHAWFIHIHLWIGVLEF